MHWLILRTDSRKEQYVAAQVRNLGFNAWVPVQLIASRPAIARRVSAKSNMRQIRELPILPRRVFVRAPFPHSFGLPRHAAGVETHADGFNIRIADSQIEAFRAAIDAENTAALALAQKASRKQKAKWRSLKDALLDMIESAKQQMEQAA